MAGAEEMRPAERPFGPEAFLWPLPQAVPSLTGTFMEFRRGRYHSGIDLRTRGREGLQVVAPAGGRVTRVRCAATGYGVAVYLTLFDGRQLVFAHLSALADRLRAPLEAAWRRSGRYRQDLDLGDGIGVQRGELLGLSGATGVGAPHLHLELRDAQERPLNPLLHGFSVPDTLAPRITAVRLVPLSSAAQVGGRPFPEDVEPGARLRASGRLGVMVRVEDRSDQGAFRLAPLGIAAWWKGTEIARLENRRFAFSQSIQMRLERAEASDPAQPPWLRLYHRPGNTLAGRRFSGTGGDLRLPEGETGDLVVAAWDAAGNRSEAVVHLRGGRPGSAGPPVPYAGESPSWPEGHPLALPARWSLPPDSGGEERDAGDLELMDPGDGLFPGGMVWWEAADEDLPIPADTRWVRSCGRIRSAGAVFRRGLVVRLEESLPPEKGNSVGLFLRDETGEWTFLGARDSTGCWFGRVDRPGWLALLQDATPPRIGPFEVEGRIVREGALVESVRRAAPTGLTLPPWPALRLAIEDTGSGLVEDAIEATIDGRLWPARYDPESHELSFEFWIEVPVGEHLFAVSAVDRLGRRSQARIRLRLGP